ncbi:Protein MET1, chloroplastic [Coccomyxa sp. Obi]|nr:Protein MET1, chloroplastic [Coccomyxa sp. Obi]
MHLTDRTLRQDALLCNSRRLGSPSASSFRAQPARQLHNFRRHQDACHQQGTVRSRLHVRSVAETKTEEQKTSARAAGQNGAPREPEFYEVSLPKPLGVRFTRGNDGSAYVVRTDAKLGSTDEQIEVGDKIVAVSASFGGDVWEAKNFGQVMYAIKTRNGDVYLKLQRNYGDTSFLLEEELSDAEKRFKMERGGGNYGVGTKEMQEANYRARKETEKKRRELFDQALSKFKQNNIEGALIDFEEVISMEPKNYLGDDFSRVTQIFRVAQYNVACCYSAINQVDAGLEALESALSAGFEQYNKVRTDPNLETLRKSPKFKKLIDQYDEPIINEGALKALKNIFSFGKKNDDED